MSTAEGRKKREETGKAGKFCLLSVLYVCTEAVMLAVLKTLEVRGGYGFTVTFLMYGAIVLNTLYTAVLFVRFLFLKKPHGRQEESGKKELRQRAVFTALALFVTLAADTVLVLIDDYYLMGVLLFCAVQTLYGIALKPGPVTGAVRIAGFLLLWLVLLLLHAAEPLNVASAYSIVQLSINTVIALKKAAKERKAGTKVCFGTALFAAGLALFWCCDLSVGIYNLSFGAEKLLALNRVTGFLMWVFYLPSQVLLVLAERRFLAGEADTYYSGDEGGERDDL